MYVCIFACTCVSLYVCMYVCICVCMYVCMYVWMYVFMYVCMFDECMCVCVIVSVRVWTSDCSTDGNSPFQCTCKYVYVHTCVKMCGLQTAGRARDGSAFQPLQRLAQQPRIQVLCRIKKLCHMTHTNDYIYICMYIRMTTYIYNENQRSTSYATYE